MKYNMRRDDSYMSRLRYFFKDKGSLDTDTISPVKSKVWKIKAYGQWWIVKAFQRKTAYKLWSLFLQLPQETSFVRFVPFPNGEKAIEDFQGYLWCLMPFINGEVFQFTDNTDRKKAIQLLTSFHHKASGLKINVSPPRSFLDKLESRIKRFMNTKDIFISQGSFMFYQKAEKDLIQKLETMGKWKWGKLEQSARRKKILIHGDSAQHNFIKDENQCYLIDFDLVHYAPLVYEWIQLAQRFLLEGLTIDDLWEYDIFRFYQQDPFFQFGLSFPNDLLREWDFQVKKVKSAHELRKMVKTFEKQWSSREKMVKTFLKYGKISNYYNKKEEIYTMKNHVEQLVNWLKQQVKEANVNGLVVGISGGIDSAVVAHLIQRAFPDRSLGVIMPCKSNPEDEKYAQMVVASSGIDSMTVDLTETHKMLFEKIKKNTKSWNEEQERIADANLRARLRMSTLYTIATNYRYLVVGTDNAAEWYTGYFTKYGDGGVDLVPLIHYTKGEVRELAKELGVPAAIIEKAPSAGLWEGQTDENEMGTTYHMIDKYIRGEEVPMEDKEIIEKMHQSTEHKRNLPKAPPIFK
jgi:NAD+ synthase